MSFFYFLATHSQKPLQTEINAARIAYAIEANKCRHNVVINGPGGNRGLILARSNAFTTNVLYKPEEQRWHKINENAWLGFFANATIGAGQLQREIMVDSEAVELADGSIWMAAHARRFIELEPGTLSTYCSLPRGLSYVDGKWISTKVQGRFREFQELAEEYQTAAAQAWENRGGEAGVITFEFPRIDDLAVMALTANYHVSHTELSVLEVYDVETRKRLVAAAMDEKTVAAWQKKRIDLGLGGIGSSDGREPSTLAEVST